MSKENLIQKIRDDTAAEVQKISSETRDVILRERQTLTDELTAEEKTEIEKAKAIVAESEKQTQMLAEIEAKKVFLKAKRDIIDKTVARAKEKMLALPDEEYIEWISTLIANKGTDGDEAIISKNDVGRITDEVIAKVAKTIGKKITLSKEVGDFSGGIILRQNGCDKNMTLETALDEIKQAYILKISTKLFSNVE